MINRTFTIVGYPNDGENYGRYIAKTPKRAANKAFTKLSRKIDLKNTNNKNLLVFIIKETTKNSDNKEYKYAGTRVELAKPVIKTINGKQIIYRYKNIIAPYNKFMSLSN